MMGYAKVRILLVCFGFVLCFTVFSFRLIHLQVSMHDEYAMVAAEKHGDTQIIPARRGTITDVHGETIADNEPVRTVVADGSLVRYTTPHGKQIDHRQELVDILAGPLGYDRKDLYEKLTTDRKYLVLKRKISQSVADELQTQIRAHSIKGITFEWDARRIYPNGQMLCHVLGYLNHDYRGVQGVEAVMDEYLRGHDGFRFIEHDRTGREIVAYRGQERLPRNGCNIQLTIDMGLQNIVENELQAAVQKYRPHAASAVFMRPSTGEILALANYPHFDLNHFKEAPMESMKNRAITDIVEPGSTFKIVAAGGALNDHIVKPSTIIFCENGRFGYGGGKALKDHHPYGNLSVTDILVKSSNIGSAKLAIMMGEQRFYEYIRKFGFGERTGVILPGEVGGLLRPPHKWEKMSITRIPMGHEIGVTPMQIVSAMSVIANGGHLMMPQIVREISDEKGKVISKTAPVEVRRVISEEAAFQVKEALKGVVGEEGTASLAQVAGFSVAGKTGTAQKVNPNGPGYMEGKYVISFVGFMPADNPEFVGLVIFDDAKTPGGQNYGGLVAAPVFSRIGERAARYLNLEPEPELVLPSKIALTNTLPD